MAKPLANGFPIGAIMVRDEVAHKVQIGESVLLTASNTACSSHETDTCTYR